MSFHLKSARQLLRQTGLDGLLLTSRENKFYTAGLYSGSGYVLITQRSCYAIVDGRYYLQQKCRMEEEVAGGVNGAVLLADDTCGFFVRLNELAVGEQVRTLGFERDGVTFSQYRKLKAALKPVLVPVAADSIRMVKDEEEIAWISRACEIADRGYSYILGQLRAGMTEKQAENRLLYYMKELGAQKESFDIIVAGGENGAKPHAKAGDRVIRDGEFVTMDFGVRVGEYCSDITRTVAVGYAPPQMSRIYELVREAQSRAINSIRPGRKCCELDRIARAFIEEAGFGKEFTHNLGHGLGIACHEPPYFSRSDETVLVPGMVMTVEPGIYVEGLGGVRIEDDVLVTEEGFKLLTRSPRELTVVGRREGIGYEQNISEKLV